MAENTVAGGHVDEMGVVEVVNTGVKNVDVVVPVVEPVGGVGMLAPPSRNRKPLISPAVFLVVWMLT
jgi:hypothetical protein